eukprot:scaffold94393_cov17-Prasinocladus_malaysianus.AAC.1
MYVVRTARAVAAEAQGSRPHLRRCVVMAGFGSLTCSSGGFLSQLLLNHNNPSMLHELSKRSELAWCGQTGSAFYMLILWPASTVNFCLHATCITQPASTDKIMPWNHCAYRAHVTRYYFFVITNPIGLHVERLTYGSPILNLSREI